jgi:hypothetical protein
MKKFAVILFLAICFLPMLSAQKTRYGQEPPVAKTGVDYPVKVHISGIRVRTDWIEPPEGSSMCTIVTADAALSGQKIELTGDCFPGHYLPHLLPGDYQARLLKDSHRIQGTPLYQEYEVVLPDRSAWRGTVTGISE